ncbi:uncharacterized protein YijF (DUF1287 family) [Breznakia sp. PF5-3]|uniref:DUF1287 domain-containing protein n=1 Tax=unclassified Breznakia TaxID=2623764 RepID=UPI002406AE0E|nr:MULTISPECIES: DUF1287 domain-containing protein [unclassified Breznakia]MDF9824213.1 uncharacterized protein YijF (DUF1287 family) [Breznakia sp. PM6-1]MDF9835011.1 uncharacterized protein YijF (DUF1287 family) [Breznakia sp. PF5-3]MDF9837256.1 uncharacterized protein YijF (DUF1287 family) [Breznakia sp. PFB2-8]MDF9859246.1 uncharacterized protein YijF (DUF1287 family) [Breznakia sp. PH5-24]
MKKKIAIMLGIVLIIILIILYLVLDYLRIIPRKYYDAKDFDIVEVISKKDADKDGIDDYHDIMLGARKDAESKPNYHSAYYEGGYPPEDEGVCTDVVWRAFHHAGYDLKAMVDKDIAENVNLYPRVAGQPDPNIDFRRVPNLLVFFERNATSLTRDLSKIEEWQPGDIVIFSDSHIGILSDKRNEDGLPWLIHNASQPNREEDTLVRWSKNEISGHYRWDGEK